MGVMSKRPYGYTKMDNEDTEEKIHQRAQFLIYKALEQADLARRRRPSFLRLRICRLKVKIGKRLKKLRKNMLFNVSITKVGIYRQALKTWKQLFCNKETVVMVSLPPMFT